MYKLTADKKLFYHTQKFFWYHGIKIEKIIYRGVKNKHNFYYLHFFSLIIDNREKHFIISEKKDVIKCFKNTKKFMEVCKKYNHENILLLFRSKK